MRRFFFPILLLCLITLTASCGKKSSEETAVTRTPVTIAIVDTGTITDSIKLSATAAYMKKSSVKATTTGFVVDVLAKTGYRVTIGKILFILKTKEASGLGRTLSSLGPELKFTGKVMIKAGIEGVVAQVNHSIGDYVPEGEQLALVNDSRSFVFLMTVPFELKSKVALNKRVSLLLPDSTTVEGSTSGYLPGTDSLSQSIIVIISTRIDKIIPENIIAAVSVETTFRSGVVYVSKTALLTDPLERSFWVMKLVNDSTAIKVPVVKGLESGDRVEVLSSKIARGDTVLVSGNYGLPDTAGVTVTGCQKD